MVCLPYIIALSRVHWTILSHNLSIHVVFLFQSFLVLNVCISVLQGSPVLVCWSDWSSTVWLDVLLWAFLFYGLFLPFADINIITLLNLIIKNTYII